MSISIDSLSNLDMKSFEDFKPGNKVESILLYFPHVKQFKIASVEECEKEFLFQDEKNQFSDIATYWIELKVIE